MGVQFRVNCLNFLFLLLFRLQHWICSTWTGIWYSFLFSYCIRWFFSIIHFLKLIILLFFLVKSLLCYCLSLRLLPFSVDQILFFYFIPLNNLFGEQFIPIHTELFLVFLTWSNMIRVVLLFYSVLKFSSQILNK